MLIKYLLQETTTGEEEQVKEWFEMDPSNLSYYNELKKTWEISLQLAEGSDVNENEAWKRFQQRIHKKAPVRTLWTGRSRIAASIVLMIGIGLLSYVLFFNNSKKVKQMLVQSHEAVFKDSLPDGSVITLNKRSSVAYPSRFKGDTRNVTLDGEAFFNVAPDKSHPFVISVKDIQIQVVGTSFNVKSNNDSIEVIVETGIVKVTRAGKTVELHPNQKAIAITKDSLLQVQGVKDHLYNYYRTKEFVCDDTPLWKLVRVLNDAYDAHISIGREELKNLSITTTFNNESFDQVLNIISLTFGIKARKEGDKVILE